MGIPGFNVWFYKQNRKAYVQLKTVQIDHVYLDMNSILHGILRKATSLAHFHKLLYKHLDGLLRVTRPRKSLMLAVDGPAPLAKLITQRERRKKTSAQEGRQRKARKKALSTNALTPGTQFMADVETSLLFWVSSRLTSYQWKDLYVEVSGATVKGEGEVKILSRLHRPWPHVQPKDTHCIVGNDADLVLMALTSYMDCLYVLNDTTSDNRIIPTTPVLSVDALHTSWDVHGVSADGFPGGSPEKMRGLKADLVFLAILCSGNDYVPPTRGVQLESYAMGVWNRYMIMRTQSRPFSSIISGQAGQEVAINTRMLAELLTHNAPVQFQKFSDNTPLNYLYGLLWVMDMYLNGLCSDYRWVYSGEAPSVGSLVAFLNEQPDALTLKNLSALLPPNGNTEPLLPHMCALALLTKENQALAISPVQPLFEAGSPIADLFSTCEECDRLTSVVVSYSKQLAEVSPMRAALNEELLEAQQVVKQLRGTRNKRMPNTAMPDPELEAARQVVAEIETRLQALEAERDRTVADYNEAMAARKRHLMDMHEEGTNFPVRRLESAVAAIPLHSCNAAERRITQFTDAYLLCRATGLSGRRWPRFTAPGPPVPGFSSIRQDILLARAVIRENANNMYLTADMTPDEPGAYQYLILDSSVEGANSSPPPSPRAIDPRRPKRPTSSTAMASTVIMGPASGSIGRQPSALVPRQTTLAQAQPTLTQTQQPLAQFQPTPAQFQPTLAQAPPTQIISAPFTTPGPRSDQAASTSADWQPDSASPAAQFQQYTWQQLRMTGSTTQPPARQKRKPRQQQQQQAVHQQNQAAPMQEQQLEEDVVGSPVGSSASGKRRRQRNRQNRNQDARGGTNSNMSIAADTTAAAEAAAAAALSAPTNTAAAAAAAAAALADLTGGGRVSYPPPPHLQTVAAFGNGAGEPLWEAPQQFGGAPQQFDGVPQQFNGAPQQFNGAPDQFNGAPQQFNRAPQQFNQAPQQFKQAPQQFNQAPDQFNGAPQQFNQAPQQFNQAPDQFNGAPQQFNGAPDQFNGAPQQFNRAPDQFNGAPQQFNRAPQQFYETPQQFYEAPQQFSEAPQQFHEAGFAPGMTWQQQELSGTAARRVPSAQIRRHTTTAGAEQASEYNRSWSNQAHRQSVNASSTSQPQFSQQGARHDGSLGLAGVHDGSLGMDGHVVQYGNGERQVHGLQGMDAHTMGYDVAEREVGDWRGVDMRSEARNSGYAGAGGQPWQNRQQPGSDWFNPRGQQQPQAQMLTWQQQMLSGAASAHTPSTPSPPFPAGARPPNRRRHPPGTGHSIRHVSHTASLVLRP